MIIFRPSAFGEKTVAWTFSPLGTKRPAARTQALGAIQIIDLRVTLMTSGSQNIRTFRSIRIAGAGDSIWRRIADDSRSSRGADRVAL